MIRTYITLSVLCLVASSLYGQTPIVLAAVNPASNTPAGLPNSGLAQGSIIVLYGKGLGPAKLVQAPSVPLPTSAGLAGTSVQIFLNQKPVDAPVIYTSDTQVAAVLPSNTALGTTTIAVTYNGQTGFLSIQVVPSNFGISTFNQTGGGPAVVTRPDYSVITVTNSAKPGETLVLWGTGLGPTNGNDAATPVAGDLGTPVQLLIGGHAATVSYRGRSGFPGLDQINFTMPNVTGCYVSLAVQTGNTVSNFTTIPVAANGGTCSDTTGLSVSGLSSALSSGAARLGGIFLSQDTATTPASGSTPASTKTTNSGYTAFYKFSAAQLTQAATFTGQPSLGGCIVTPVNSSGSSPTNSFNATVLDAGTVNLSAADSSGNSQVSNGNGGADVKNFSTTVNVGARLNWTNESNVATVDRTQPFQVTWNGGNPNGFVTITGYSASTTGSGPVVGANFTCTAPVADGQFTIPPAVLLSLPPSSAAQSGTMSVGSYSNQIPFNASGLDYGYTISGNSSSTLMTYK